VYACVASLVAGDRQTAEEIHQQVWLAAIESIDGFDPVRGDFRAWVCGIARRQVAWHFRRQRSARLATGTEELPDAQLPPPDLAEEVELTALVRAAVATLPDESRAAVLAKYGEGLTVADIAARQGKSPKAVESLLARARQRLRELLEKHVTAPALHTTR
jgi:RNA polymerase sigma-70 factor (ECF subfamily)